MSSCCLKQFVMTRSGLHACNKAFAAWASSSASLTTAQIGKPDFLNVVFEVPEQAIGILVSVQGLGRQKWKPEGKHVTRHLFHVWSVVMFVFAVVQRLSTYIYHTKYITCDFTRYLLVTLLPGEHRSH